MMEIKWQVATQQSQTMKQFLLKNGISQRLYAKIKARGLPVRLNNRLSSPADQVQNGDQVSLTLRRT
ncbi:hypothetical protein QY895_07290 [Latilactobacillus sakei]